MITTIWNVVDGIPSVSGAATMFLTSAGAYGYAAPGGLAVMPNDGYQQALHQQQVGNNTQPFLAALNTHILDVRKC